MAFPPSFLAELAARNPIEDVVGQYVNLRRSGSNLPVSRRKDGVFLCLAGQGDFLLFRLPQGWQRDQF